jgi:hypothetical protein
VAGQILQLGDPAPVKTMLGDVVNSSAIGRFQVGRGARNRIGLQRNEWLLIGQMGWTERIGDRWIKNVVRSGFRHGGGMVT